MSTLNSTGKIVSVMFYDISKNRLQKCLQFFKKMRQNQAFLCGRNEGQTIFGMRIFIVAEILHISIYD